MVSVADKTVLVTGASRGIRQALVGADALFGADPPVRS
jgi:NAD(P)-dependent dehydrogenase (short-subunit alcohol dehydrogenase family)